MCSESDLKKSDFILVFLLLYHKPILILGVLENIDTHEYRDILFGNTVSILKNIISIFKNRKKLSYRVHGSCFVLSSYPDR